MRILHKLLCTCSNAWFTVPLRFALGMIFLGHGAQKLFGWFGGHGLAGMSGMLEQLGMYPPMFWAVLAALGEFGGGLLILLGLFTRFGAFNIMVVMLVAIFQVHWGQSWIPRFFLPHGIEYAFALLCAAVTLLIAGGGALSLDSLLTKKCSCHESKADDK